MSASRSTLLSAERLVVLGAILCTRQGAVSDTRVGQHVDTFFKLKALSVRSNIWLVTQEGFLLYSLYFNFKSYFDFVEFPF